MIFQFFRKFCWIIFLVVMVVGGGCVSFDCFWHWRVWDGTGGAWACSPRGLHLLQLQSRGSQGHPWTVAHAGNWLHGLGEVMADYPAIFSTTTTAGSCPTVTWERRCPYGFIDGLLWDQTETLFRRTGGSSPGPWQWLARRMSQCWPENLTPPLLPIHLFSWSGMLTLASYRHCVALNKSVLLSGPLVLSVQWGMLDWVVTKILSSSYILWFLKIEYFHGSINDNKCSNMTEWKSCAKGFEKLGILVLVLIPTSCMTLCLSPYIPRLLKFHVCKIWLSIHLQTFISKNSATAWKIIWNIFFLKGVCYC